MANSGFEPDKTDFSQNVFPLAERPLDNVLPFPVRRRRRYLLRAQRADIIVIARSVPVSDKA
ncbi:MAG TPA: hypothetical protein DCY50_04405, partial [Franconibacter helveticus]|nr:hypothetical protein [Franconibacter helveticus]